MQDNELKDVNSMTFEEALNELEVIVRQLEAGKVKLEDAVNAYARGVELRKKCEEKLNEARLKIEKITLSSDGSVKGLEDFAVE